MYSGAAAMLEVEFRRRLERRLGKPVSLTVTANRTAILSVKPDRSGLVRVRAHHMFLDAPPDVVGALAQFVRRPTPACHSALNGYIRAKRHRIGSRPRRRAPINLSHRGFHFDLREIYDKLNERYFDSRLRAAITWGRSNGKGRRYSIDFGSFDKERRVIRVNPALDRPSVPRFFVDYIVYHEMLHAAIGFKEGANGRRDLHSPRFRSRERRFRFYRSATRWETANLWRFLRTT